MDDEPAWLSSLALTLKSCAGLTNITTCQDSRQVMGLLDQGGIGLVMLDLTMPFLSGEELLAQIGEQPSGNHRHRRQRPEPAGDRGALHETGRLRLLHQDR